MLQQRTQGKTIDLISEQNMDVTGNSFSNMYSPHTVTGTKSMTLQNKEHQLDMLNNGSLAGSPDVKRMEKPAHMQTSLRSVGPVDGIESQTMNESLTPLSQNPVGDPNCGSMDWDGETFLETFNNCHPEVPPEVKLHSQHAFVVGTTSTNVTDSFPPNHAIHNEMAQVEVTGSFPPDQTIPNQMAEFATDSNYDKCSDLIKYIEGHNMEIEGNFSKLLCSQNPIENESGEFEDVTVQQSVERCQSVEGEGYLRTLLPKSIPDHQNSAFQQYSERTSCDIDVANSRNIFGQTFMPNENREDIFEETPNNLGYYRSRDNIPTSYPTTFLGGSSDLHIGSASSDHHVPSDDHGQIHAATINFEDLNSPSSTSGSYQDDSNVELDVQSSQGGESYWGESSGAWSPDIPSSVKDIEDSGDECEELDFAKSPSFSSSAATEVKQPGRRASPCHSKQKTIPSFLRECLNNPECNPSLLSWVSEASGHFQIVKSQKENIAALWGKRRDTSLNKEPLTYNSFARAMRNYYRGKGLKRVEGKKLQYILQ